MESGYISALSLKRLFQKAGIYRVSSDSYNKAHLMVEDFVENLLEKASTFSKRNVIGTESIHKGELVDNLLKIVDEQAGGGDNYCDGEPSQCGGRAFCDGDISQCGQFSEEVVEACKTQEGGDYYFSIPKSQFRRLVQSKMSEFSGLVITKSAVERLQFNVENKIISNLASLKNDKKIFKL